MRISLVALSVVLLLLANLASAQIERTCVISAEWSGTGLPGQIAWKSLAYLGILVILLFLSIVYMGAVLFKQVRWIVWAKDEFYQALISVFIILMMDFLALSLCEFSIGFAGNDPFTVADIYLNDMLWQHTMKVAMNVYLSSLYAQITAAYFAPLGAPPSGTRPFAGLDAVAAVFDYLFTITSMIFASLLMQIIILKLIQAFAMKVMLPLGVFFGVYQVLRVAGAKFLSMALGLYFVYPLMFVVDKKIVDGLGIRTTLNFEGALSEKPKDDDVLLTMIGFLFQVKPFSNTEMVAKLIPIAFFLPTLNFAVTYTFIKAMTKVFSQNFPSPFEEGGG